MGMNIDITVPTSLKDITLKDYQEFVKIANEKDIEDVFIRQKMIQIFCHVPLLAVNKMARKDFIVVSNAIIEVLNEKPPLKRITTINGQKYGFVPNLNDDMSLGEFVDLDEYMKDWGTFHNAMSVLYRKVTLEKGGNYRIEDYNTDSVNSEIMLDMTMDVVMGAVVFFWTLSNQLLQITPKYLTQLLRKDKKAAEALEKSGVGISTFTNSLEEACLRLQKLVPYT